MSLPMTLAAPAPIRASVPDSDSDHDARLQLSRRVDWRFLLPRPELERVAYIGRQDAELIASLRAFSSHCELLPADSSGTPAAERFTTVIAGNPTVEEFRCAVAAVVPGGAVYAEVERALPRSNRPLRSTLGTVSQARRFAAQLGLQQVQVHAHWPNFASCTELLPLDQPAAVRCALRRRGTGFSSRCKGMVVRIMFQLGMLESWIPCYSLLGFRADAVRDSE